MEQNTNNNSGASPEPTTDYPTPAQPVNVTPVQPPQKKRSPRLVIGGIVAAVLILLGGGGALAYTMLYQNPDKVVHDAILNVIQAKTMSTEGTITYKDEGVAIDLDLSGTSNQSEGEFSVSAKVAIDTAEMRQDFEAKGSGKVIGDTFYFKLDGVKQLVENVASESQGQVPQYAVDIIAKIDNRWISVKASDYQDIYEDLAKQQTCFTDLAAKIDSDKAMLNELSDLYNKNRIITIEEELGSKDVNGVGSLGYKIAVDQTSTAAFVRGLENTQLGNELKNCDDSLDFADLADDLAQETEKAEHVPTVELWVSRFGHEITKFSVYGDTSDSGNLSIELLPAFNNEVTIEAPADAASFETVMEDIRTVINEYSAQESSPGSAIMPADLEFYDDIDYSAV